MAYKRPLILFTGGADSTYLLHHTLANLSDADVLYIEGPIGASKIKAEKIARLDILDKLKDMGLRFEVRQELSVDLSGLRSNRKQCFAQPYLWLLGALNALDPDEHSSVQIAYLFGDDAGTVNSELISAWDHLVYVTFRDRIRLEFPLLDHGVRKSYILENLDGSLKELTHSCELPAINDFGKVLTCGTCAACLTREVEEYRISLKNARTPSSSTTAILKTDIVKIEPSQNEVSLFTTKPKSLFTHC
jgi:hypothetical protein